MPETMIKTADMADMSQAIYGGVGHGSVAKRLLQSGLDTSGLRSLDTLRDKEWEAVDTVVIEAARRRMRGVEDLRRNGCIFTLSNELRETVLKSQTASDMTDAEMSMSPRTRGQQDNIDFAKTFLPLPITFKDFTLDIRDLNMSRALGTPLNLLHAQIAGKKVMEKVEETLFKGASTYKFGGGTVYGYEDTLQAESESFSNGYWNDTADGDDILTDVTNLKQKLVDSRHFGPYMLYVPTVYETKLDMNYVANYPLTIRNRIKQIDGIQDVAVSDFLTAHRVVLVQMDPSTVRIVTALNLQTVEWTEMGGFELQFKVLTIQVPEIRSDYEGLNGIARLS
jgi:uncharacterized linocin/CFP29 family protein